MSGDRADRLAAHVAERGLDLLLVSAPLDVRWACGFTGSSGLALLGAPGRWFVTDSRYVEQAAAQVADFDHVRAEQDLLEPLPGLLPDGDLRLGFDDEHLTVARHAHLRELLPDRVELVAAGGAVGGLREIKDADEQERIRAAARLADAAFEETVAAGLAGRTEREVALALEDAMRARGGATASFPSIVAAGAHGALPHAEPRDVEIPTGTLVVIDWGAELDGYCSDCTRTLATGPVDGEARAAYELVLAAQLAGLEAVRPGPTGREVDAAARRVIDDGGRGDEFGHGLGHGVGLEVHEGPRLSKRGTSSLRPGHVVTVEPGVYLPGRVGVRIEDLVIVTDGGHEVLSDYPKGLTVVG